MSVQLGLPAPAHETQAAGPLTDFGSASRRVLAYLRDRTGLALWMLTRTVDDDWIVLAADDGHYGVSSGDVFRWSDSFCSRMVRGEGPRAAPRSDEVAAYAASPIRRQLDIEAYIGVPITDDDGRMLGTLCGIDPSSQPDALVRELPLVELMAALLGGILAGERRADEASRRAERAEALSTTDALTGLANRRGWDAVVAAEESRCARHGDPASVLMLDLDRLKETNDARGHAAGDALLRRAARAIAGAVRAHDFVARLGGDEFGVIGVGTDAAGAQALYGHVAGALQAAGIEISIGLALRNPSRGLVSAVHDADVAMYRLKQAKRASRRASSRATSR